MGSRSDIFHIWSIHLLTSKAAVFEWGPEPKRTLKQSLAVMQADFPPGPYDPSEPVVRGIGGEKNTTM